MDAPEPTEAPLPVDELVRMIGGLDRMRPASDPAARAEFIASVASELGVELTAEVLARLDEGWQYARERAQPKRAPSHLRAEAERQLAAEGIDASTAPAWLIEGVEDGLLEEEAQGSRLWDSFAYSCLSEAEELRDDAACKEASARRLELLGQLAAAGAPEIAKLNWALAGEAREDAKTLSERAHRLESASRECHDWTAAEAEQFGAATRDHSRDRSSRRRQWDTWTAGVGSLMLSRRPCKHTIRQRSVSRPRSRRHAARRAAGIRSGQDPGEEDPDHHRARGYLVVSAGSSVLSCSELEGGRVALGEPGE